MQTGIKKTLKKGPAAIEAQLTKVGRRDLVDVANRKLGMLLKTCRKAKVGSLGGWGGEILLGGGEVQGGRVV